MSSYNRVILVGNLTRDAELRYTPGGTAVTDLGLAVNEKRKVNEEWVEEVTYIDVTLWGRTAEVASEYLSKGSSCLIEGRLKLDQWEQDGQKRSKLKVVGEKMQILSKRDQQGASEATMDVYRSQSPGDPPGSVRPQHEPTTQPPVDGSIPF